MAKKVVITGATSMIGVALAEECVKMGLNVVAVVRPGSTRLGRLKNLNIAETVECDISEYHLLPEKITSPCSLFYHLAWSGTGSLRNSSASAQQKNVFAILSAVKAASLLGCEAFIGAGSQAEYGRVHHGKISEVTPTQPETPYGKSKLEACILASRTCSELNIRFVWPRIFSVYGPNDKESSMISSSIKKLLKNEDVLFSAGEQNWDYLFSSDAGRALFLLGTKTNAEGVYCLASGESRRLKDFIYIMRDAVSPSLSVQLGKIPHNEKTVINLSANIDKLKRDTGFSPLIAFEEGIRMTVDAMERT